MLRSSYADSTNIIVWRGTYKINSKKTENVQNYHLQWIRPKNQIYGETKDIYGNLFEEFVKVNFE